MKKRIVACPACAAPVEIQLSTALVTICDFCRSIVARADKKVEDHGKVSDLVDTNSPIQRGVVGVFEKKRFEVVGRVQYQHPAGGVWNEWYLLFPANKVGWLAEAQGKFFLTLKKSFAAEMELPSFESLTVGHRFELGSGKELVVAEKGIATARSADGDIPWAFRPNAEHRFVDLHGAGGEFATLEYAESGPRGFLGREVTLEELQLEGDGWVMSVPAGPNTAALQLNCPNCAGPLTLHAPDQTQRVTCPNCKGLLDCEQGKLQYLQTLNLPVVKPLIPLGTIGKLFDTEYTVIGFMERFAVWEGQKFPWTEYLLYDAAKGFRWLVRNQGHWSFVESVPLSRAAELSGNRATFDGTTFKLYDRSTAHVRFVVGEFYWRVTVNETVSCADYIAPPRMLSFEKTEAEKGQEINASVGTYLEIETVQAAFGVQDLPQPFGVGTIQPQPSRADIWTIWAGFALLLMVLDFAFVSGVVKQPVSQFHFFMALFFLSLFPLLLLVLRWTFEVSRWQNSDFSPYQSSG